MSTYSQSRLTCTFFLGGEFWGDWVEKPCSKLGLDFSKRGLSTSSYTSLFSSSTITLRSIDWQTQMQFLAKQSWKVIF